MKRLLNCGIICLLVFCTNSISKVFSDLPDPKFGFKTFFCTWGGTDSPEFKRFLTAARPEIVQVGFYGPMFHGYADNSKSTGYPMQLPVSGQYKALAAQKSINNTIHSLGLKVIGHFQMVNVIINDTHTYDFFDFYENHWPADLLGQKPISDINQILQRDINGNVIIKKHYVDYVGLCLSSPYTRKMLKSMLRLAIRSGLDGVITNYNYYWSCNCPYCQESFRRFLAKKYSQTELKKKFGIDDIKTYKIKINAEIPGYPLEKAEPLDYEAMEWAAISFKNAYDDIIINYGRMLKPDLIVATWNHIGNMSITEERMFLPKNLWGRAENYFWYSGGYGPTDLKQKKLGDGWLDCLYIREMSGGKPFMLGKYESVRIKNSIAEGLATGGSGMGLYINIKNPDGFAGATRYMEFVHKNRNLYSIDEPFSEIGIVFPRISIKSGYKQCMDSFKEIGEYLAQNHVFFDVICDENINSKKISSYKVIICPEIYVLEDKKTALLDEFVKKGGTVCFINKNSASIIRKNSPPLVFEAEKNTDIISSSIKNIIGDLSSIDAPFTIRTSAFSKNNRRIVIHIVNYNRDEEKGKKLSGPSDEFPIPEKNIKVKLIVPKSAKTARVMLLSPDNQEKQLLPCIIHKGWMETYIPEILVYGVLDVSFGN